MYLPFFGVLQRVRRLSNVRSKHAYGQPTKIWIDWVIYPTRSERKEKLWIQFLLLWIVCINM